MTMRTSCPRRLSASGKRLGDIGQTTGFGEAFDFGGNEKNIHELKTNSGAFGHDNDSLVRDGKPLPIVS